MVPSLGRARRSRSGVRPQPSLAIAGISLLSMMLSCGVGDQECPADWLANDLADACPYGPPGGPQKKKLLRECPLVTIDKTAAICSSISFDGDVFPILTTGNGNCTSTGCHGTTQDGVKANGLFFPPDITAQDFYDRLLAYKNPQGDAYWGTDDDHAWVQCNLLASPGGGSPMPKPGGLTDSADQTAVTNWINCGMPGPGMGAGGGGTGSSSSSTGGG